MSEPKVMFVADTVRIVSTDGSLNPSRLVVEEVIGRDRMSHLRWQDLDVANHTPVLKLLGAMLEELKAWSQEAGEKPEPPPAPTSENDIPF